MFRRRVQVLVILVLVVVVASLVVPGINRVHDTANRARCANNLKQLAMAVHNYNAQFDKLPPIVDQGETAPTGQGLRSIFAVLSPYIEAHATHYSPHRSPPADYYAHSSVVYTFDWKGETRKDNGGFANQIWPILIDPSDYTSTNGLRDVPMTLPDGATGYYATGSYVANGMVPWGRGGIPRSFTGGTKSKILFAERPQVCRTSAGDTVYNLWGLGFYSPHMPAFATLTPTEPGGLASTEQVAPVQPLPGLETDHAQLKFRIGRKDGAVGLPDFPTPLQILRGGGQCDPRLPGSPHPSGMQAAMADGSVREFAPDTSPFVFWAACSPGWFKFPNNNW